MLHSAWLKGWSTCPVGLTVMVKVFDGPVQEMSEWVKVGVTTIVATTGDTPVLMAVNALISPVPLETRPMLVWLLVHAYVVVPPEFEVVKTTAAVEALLQSAWLVGWLTSADGLTVMVKVFGSPVQETPSLVKVGVTTIVATTGTAPVLTAVNALMFPVPLEARPMLDWSFVQAYVVVPPEFEVVKTTAVVDRLLQTTWLVGWSTCPIWLTIMVTLLEPAGLPVAHVSLEVRMHLTESLFTGVKL